MKFILITTAILALGCSKNKPITDKPEVIMEQQKKYRPNLSI